ncbi:MAG TPA: hypothetical protein VMV72_15225 [Verrucomicrobiae bacterium]|nr:hypothetical protein [Verrucomicrobiae bacterium]
MDAKTTAYWIGVLAGGLVVGTLCGLIPFFVGRKKGQSTLGIAGLIVCMLSGLVLGVILALPASIIFTIVIVFASPKAPPPPPLPNRM